MEKKADKLLEKYISGDCTPEEIALLQQWYLQLPTNRIAPSYDCIENAKLLAWKQLSVNSVGRVRRITFRKVAVAASILLCFTLGSYFLSKELLPTEHITQLNDVLPGSNKALLTLENGTVIDLDAAKNGEIAKQNGMVVRKANNGQLEYNLMQAEETSQRIGNNVISTPRGGQYKVILPDGSRVWLNAASSLKYPIKFAKNERKVILSGEAYFEVAKEKVRPFLVETGKQIIEVLGTHFNVNAYLDEDLIKTTLLEGSVNVKGISETTRLYPGQQAQLKHSGFLLHIDKTIDLEKEVAWKNDLFSFENDDLKSIMRQISRWYDIDVVYEGKIPDEKYIGEIPRNSNLGEVFKILEFNHVHIDAKGKLLIVSGSKN